MRVLWFVITIIRCIKDLDFKYVIFKDRKSKSGDDVMVKGTLSRSAFDSFLLFEISISCYDIAKITVTATKNAEHF